MKNALLESNTKNRQQLRSDVNKSIRVLASKVDTALASRVAQLEAVLKNPEGERDRIEEEIREVVRARQTLKGFEERVMAVRDEARRLAQTTGVV